MKLAKTLSTLSVLALVLTTGCASNVKASRTDNPPPKEAYSKFGRIELKPAVLAPEFQGQSANEKSLVKINANLEKRTAEHIKRWNSRASNGRTLILEPVVVDIRYIGVAARIFAGPLAGSSGVVIKMKASDAQTGQVIDNPEFYQRASAGAGFAVGVADNLMLTRVGELVGDYIIRNYDKAVGGSTGATHELVDPNSKAAQK
jgi:hypothetical protein